MYLVNANQLVNLIENIVSKFIVNSVQDTVYENEMTRAIRHFCRELLPQFSTYSG